jgi:hypothetical protein
MSTVPRRLLTAEEFAALPSEGCGWSWCEARLLQCRPRLRTKAH